MTAEIFYTNYLEQIFNIGIMTCAGYDNTWNANLDNTDATTSEKHI